MTGAYTSERVIANKQNSITPKIINKLNASLSKTGKSVLIALYKTPQIQQKVLAVNINTSPNSLSNLLSKMEAIKPQLLHIDPVGRSKYYSLTEIAGQYVASELIPKESFSLHKIYDELSNSALTDRLENYLKNSSGDSYALTPLFDLEKQNAQKAIELINYAFAEMRPQIFGKDDLSLFSKKELPVSEAQYNAIFHNLSIMVNDFADCHKSKLQILKDWETRLSASNISLYFIAEKCNTVYLKESEKHSS